MSWFMLKDQPVRKKRKGIWLKPGFGSNPDLKLIVERSGRMRKSETVQRIVVSEVRPGGKLLLEVWCVAPADILKRPRYNVFYLLVDENEEWTCEGDLGRGLA